MPAVMEVYDRVIQCHTSRKPKLEVRRLRIQKTGNIFDNDGVDPEMDSGEADDNQEIVTRVSNQFKRLN